MDWTRDLKTWPHAALSRRVRVPPCDWHVQEAGDGPLILLIHGTGSSTHSWRDLIPILAGSHRVVAVDLPGHGFTRTTAIHRTGLADMTADVIALCCDQCWQPALVVGHSAGAAIALDMARQGLAERVVGINPALAPFRGLAAVLFPAAARLLSATPFAVDGILRTMMSSARIDSVLTGTGSTLDATGRDLYARLFRDRDHVQAAVAMMANWHLDPLLAALPEITADCLFLCGGNDKAVPPDVALRAAARMPSARVEVFDGYGHLIHEEAPALIADWILRWAQGADATLDA